MMIYVVVSDILDFSILLGEMIQFDYCIRLHKMVGLDWWYGVGGKALFFGRIAKVWIQNMSLVLLFYECVIDKNV